MKRRMKIEFSIVLSVLLSVFSLTSCESTRGVDVKKIEQEINKSSAFTAEDLSNATIALVRASYSNRLCTTEHLFTERVMSDLGEERLATFKNYERILATSTRSLGSSQTQLYEILNALKGVIYDEDPTKLTSLFNEYYLSPEYKSLDSETQMNIRTIFEAIEMSRYEILMIVIQNNGSLRMSPGDRMIMSEWAKHAKQEDIERAIEWGVIGITSVAGKVGTAISAAYSFVKSLF